jgi:hypothetical protein
MSKILSENFHLLPNPKPVRRGQYAEKGRAKILSLDASLAHGRRSSPGPDIGRQSYAVSMV